MRTVTTIVFCFIALPWLTAQDDVKPRGHWVAVAYDQNGIRAPADIAKKMKITIFDDKIIIKPRIVVQYKPIFDSGKKNVDVVFSIEADKSDEVAYKLDQAKGRIDLVWRGERGDTKTTRGLYLLEGDELKICFALADKNRPKSFPDNPKTGLVRMVLKRATK